MNNILWFSFALIIGMSWIITFIQREEHLNGIGWRISLTRFINYAGSIFLVLCQPEFYNCYDEEGRFPIEDYVLGVAGMGVTLVGVTLAAALILWLAADILQMDTTTLVHKILNGRPDFLKKED